MIFVYLNFETSRPYEIFLMTNITQSTVSIYIATYIAINNHLLLNYIIVTGHTYVLVITVL